MKKIKYLIITIFICLTTLCSAQIRFGYKPKELKIEFMGSEINSGYTYFGSEIVTITKNNVLSIYMFDEDNNCFAIIITPGDIFILNDYVNMFDKNYTRIYEGTWIKNSTYGLIEIKLIVSEYPYFICKIKHKNNDE